nr:hypothetical protein [Moraxella atlantae]
MAVKYQLPLLSASAIAQQGQLALYEAYLGTGCYQCVFPETGTQDDTRNCATSAYLPVRHKSWQTYKHKLL